MVRASRWILLLTILLGCVGCDQATKSAARAHLLPGATVSLAGGLLRLEYTENSGAFLGLGESLPRGVRECLLELGGLGLIAATAVWALGPRRRTLAQTLGAGLLCGGGISNLIDRLAHGGAVTDFLNLGIGPLRTGIFNLADSALLVGLALIAAAGIAEARDPPPPRRASP